MKVGILTFHWGTNYGGVLQCYAMQETLKDIGHEVLVINYAPKTFRDNCLLCFKHKKISDIRKDLVEYKKEKKFKKFRNQYLNLTKRFYNIDMMSNFCMDFDAIICGSDQIWNPYTIETYGAPYLLPFNLKSTLKIAYAVSLGCNKYPFEKLKMVSDKIRAFDFVSVREKSAVDIINSIRPLKDTLLMPDPVLLLDPSKVLRNFELVCSTNKSVFFYILQNNQNLILSIRKFVADKENVIDAHTKYGANSILEWCSNIVNAKYVVSNSFHGIVFCILFNKPFVAVLVEGKLEGMNDRIHTLLEYFDLTNRIITDNSEKKFENILIDHNIDWNTVNDKLRILKLKGISFLEECLNPR